jgi:hypothetical protein
VTTRPLLSSARLAALALPALVAALQAPAPPIREPRNRRVEL